MHDAKDRAPFQVRDKVILDYSRYNDPHGVWWVSPEMDELVGNELTISHITKVRWAEDCWICKIKEDPYDLNFDSLWFHSPYSFSAQNNELDKMFEGFEGL